jgi:protocatechuate 3,4-dioxygenase beta subunit
LQSTQPDPLNRNRVSIVSASGDMAGQLDNPDSFERERTVTLKKSGTLTGVILKPDGSPLAGAEVQALSVSVDETRSQLRQFSFEGKPFNTNDEGRYRIVGMVAGLTYVVQAKAQGYGESNYSSTKSVSPEPSGTAELEPITLPIADAVLSGRVTDADGAPVAGMEIHVQKSNNNGLLIQRADKDGRFKFQNVVPEQVILTGRMPRSDRPSFARRVNPSEFSDLKIVVGNDQSAKPPAAPYGAIVPEPSTLAPTEKPK